MKQVYVLAVVLCLYLVLFMFSTVFNTDDSDEGNAHRLT